MEALETLVDMLDTSARTHADNPLFGTKTGGEYHWMTYAQFARQVDHMRGALADLGFQAGERLAIISSNRVELATCAFAAFQLGGSLATMYEFQSIDDWKYIMEDAEPSILLVARADIQKQVAPIAENLPSLKAMIGIEAPESPFHDYTGLLEKGAGLSVPVAAINPDEMAALIYTSGTTGKPKGVMLSHRNLTSNINAIHEVFPLDQSDTSLSFLPWAHAFGQMELYFLMSNGAQIGLAERVDTVIENLAEIRPTILVSVPRIFNRIYAGMHKKMAAEPPLRRKIFEAGLANADKLRALREEGKSEGLTGAMNKLYDRLVFSKVRERLGGRLKYAISGGAALSKEVALFIDNLSITVYEGYGLSETAPIITANYPGQRRIGSVGKPIPGVRVEIDPNVTGAEGNIGEVISYGPNTMMGYFNQPEKTEKTMTPDGGFRTGDLGYLDEDGFLFIVGRVKEQFKLENGKFVAPAPLEESLQLSPYIQQAMVYGQNKPHNIVLLVPEFEAVAEQLRNRNLEVPDRKRMANSPDVKRLLEAEVQKYSKDWRSYERPRAVQILSEEWTTDNDMLTPTMKLKRPKVLKNYQDQIENLYQGYA